jgi:hypothetical protein
MQWWSCLNDPWSSMGAAVLIRITIWSISESPFLRQEKIRQRFRILVRNSWQVQFYHNGTNVRRNAHHDAGQHLGYRPIITWSPGIYSSSVWMRRPCTMDPRGWLRGNVYMIWPRTTFLNDQCAMMQLCIQNGYRNWKAHCLLILHTPDSPVLSLNS